MSRRCSRSRPPLPDLWTPHQHALLPLRSITSSSSRRRLTLVRSCLTIACSKYMKSDTKEEVKTRGCYEWTGLPKALRATTSNCEDGY
ncbi:unnamed protein product [Urochloa humidicola]